LVILKIGFWVSVALVLYVYVGYPVLIYIWSRLRPHPSLPAGESVELPTVTVVIPAYNEERWIRHKIENTLALDYPRERMNVLVASDGSTDATAAIAGEFESRGVGVRHFPERMGKTTLLNHVVPQAKGKIVLLTDANALLAPDALRLLAEHCRDPQVSCASGVRVCSPTPSFATEGEGLYWRYESWIKQSESRFHSSLGAQGQILALRHSAFPPIPAIGDDFFIPMKILLGTGARVILEPRAIAWIPAAATLRQEFERKVRSHVSLLCDLPYLKEGLNPWASGIWWQFLSHHLLRLFVPFGMMGALLFSVPLWAEGSTFLAALAGQGVLYGAALAGFWMGRRGLRWTVFYLPFYFCFANAAVLVAWRRWSRRKVQYAWERTERIPPSPAPSTEAPSKFQLD
jgi:cellulose synthase/poly-beta-1,6-N-acetylglucosamine synthase-like glycosyltransferase